MRFALFDGTGIRIGEFDHLLLHIRIETRAAIAPSTKRLMALLGAVYPDLGSEESMIEWCYRMVLSC